MNDQVCIKCLKKVNNNVDQKVTEYAFKNMQVFLSSWSKINMHVDISHRMRNLDYSENMLIHKACYSVLTHKPNLQNAIERYNSDNSVISSEIETSIITSPKHIAPDTMSDHEQQE